MGFSSKNDLHLIRGPGVEVDRLDLADMRPHTAVDARATNAKKNAADRV
jgi:hypothetical protein